MPEQCQPTCCHTSPALCPVLQHQTTPAWNRPWGDNQTLHMEKFLILPILFPLPHHKAACTAQLLGPRSPACIWQDRQ